MNFNLKRHIQTNQLQDKEKYSIKIGKDYKHSTKERNTNDKKKP